jgi:hypothetical protein
MYIPGAHSRALTLITTVRAGVLLLHPFLSRRGKVKFSLCFDGDGDGDGDDD